MHSVTLDTEFCSYQVKLTDTGMISLLCILNKDIVRQL